MDEIIDNFINLIDELIGDVEITDERYYILEAARLTIGKTIYLISGNDVINRIISNILKT